MTLQDKSFPKFLAVALMALVPLLYSNSIFATENQTGNPNSTDSNLFVTCSASKTITEIGSTIQLNAWVAPFDDQIYKYEWFVKVGKIKGTGREVQWDLSGIMPGSYYTSIKVTNSSNQSAKAACEVIIQSKPLVIKGGRETGYSFLSQGQFEEKGYGLYSYILLGENVNQNNRDRYRNIIIEFLKFPPIKAFKRYKKLAQLNITYIPIQNENTKEIISLINKAKLKAAADLILSHYDYARARVLLSNIDGNHRKGPYIVSSLKPHHTQPEGQRPYLFQDQSRVPSHLVSAWVREFLNQAQQSNFWEEDTLRLVLLKLRTTIGILSIGLPEVRKSIEKVTKLIT